MALAGGLLQGNFGGGLLGANQAYQEHGERKLKRGLLEAQIAENLAQAEERKAKVAKASEMNGLIKNIFGEGGFSAPQVSPGAFRPSADGMGPTLPQEMVGQSAPGSRMANLGFDQLAALKLGGVDLTELHKYANDPMKMEGGSTYVNRVTGQREYVPKIGEGMGANGRGGFADLEGYAAGVANIEGAKTAANERAKAGFDLVQVYNPQTRQMDFKPRSQVLGGQQPAPAQFTPQPAIGPRFAPQSQQMPAPTPGVNGSFVGDPTQVMEAITQIRDPQERANAMAAFTEQARRTQGFAKNGFSAGPSADDAAAAAAAKVKAEADARLGADRDNERTKRTDKATDMLPQIARARELLQLGPTASGLGAMVDQVGAWAGQTSTSANAASALETLAGNLTAAVPRMEGPQSNIDVQNYAVQAGRVGDRTLPVAQRLASLNEVERIQKKYAHLNGGEQGASNKAEEPKASKTVVKTGTYGGRKVVQYSDGSTAYAN